MNLATFRFRIVASAVLTALVAVVVVWQSTAMTAAAVLRPHPRTLVKDALVALCRADPVARDLDLGPIQVKGYDKAGGGPSPGEALDLSDWPQLGIGEMATQQVGHQWLTLTHVAEEGSCAWVKTVEGPPSDVARAFQLGGSLGVFLALLATGALTYAFAVVPLVRRIDRIRAAALRIGQADYATAADRVHDALGDISGVLDTSHARLVEDRAELVRRHEALERYLAEIAHDLRTPIGSLVLALQEVRAEVPAAREVTRRALTDAAYLGALVENLHQAARLRYGLDPREGCVDLRDLVVRLEVRFAALGEVQGVDVGAAVPDAPAVARCTPVLAERAVANLLQNSLAHGATRLALRLELEGDAFVLTVLDNGPGVPEPADLGLRTFTQREDRPRNEGLGLAITNEIVRRTGWSISYQTPEEGGLMVVVRGPLEGAAGLAL